MTPKHLNKCVEESLGTSVPVMSAPMLFSVLLCLLVTTSCSLKTGVTNLENYDQPLGIREKPFNYLEWEAFTPRIIKDHVDMAFGIGYNRGVEEGFITADDGETHWPQTKTNMWDFHLGARFFPLGVRDQKIVPYVGGGVGYYEYNEETTKSAEYVDDYDEGGDSYKVNRRHDTQAHGYFNYLSIGMYVPLKKNCMLQTEFRRDFDKDHKQYDLSGYQVTVGLAFMYD